MSRTVTARMKKDAVFETLRKTLPDAMMAELAGGAVEAGAEMVQLARAFAPERSGELKASIVMTKAGEKTPAYSQPGGATVVPSGAVLITAGNSRVRHAHLVEYGAAAHDNSGGPETKTGRLRSRPAGTIRSHPGTKGQPFFWPAYRLIRKKAKSRMVRRLNRAVRQVTGQGR